MVRCFLLAYLYIGYWYRYCGNLSSNCISDTFLTAVKPVNTSDVPFFFSLLTSKSVRRTFFLVWFKKNQQHFSPCFEVFKLHLPVSLFSLNKPGVTSVCSAASNNNCPTLTLNCLPLKRFFYSFCGIASSKYVGQSYLPSVSPLNQTPPTYLLDFNL